MVPKINGDKRFCSDLSRLNAVTKPAHWPVPIFPTADKLSNSWSTLLDMAGAFWQVKIRAEDRPKTGFITPDSIHEWTQMCFGLINAGSAFAIDGIMIHSKNFDEHL